MATKPAANDEWQERVEWHNIVAWQRLAEIVGEYVKKGAKLYIEGELQTSNWEDKQSGDRKYRTEIVARDLVLLGNGNGHSADDTGTGRRGTPASSHAAQPHEEEFDHAEITDEDIPF